MNTSRDAESISTHTTKFPTKTVQYVSTNPLRTIIAGTIGSLLVMFGSYGVGWLIDASPIRRWDWVIQLRFNVPGIVFSIILLAVGGMLMCREWLRLTQKMKGWGPPSKKWTWAAVISWSLPQVFAVPLFSRDIFSYFGQGRVMLAGLNPYEHGVSSINNFFQYGADPMWAQSPPPYGPFFLWIEKLVAWASGDNVDLGLFLFRIVAVLGVVIICFYVPKLAKLHGFDENRALWLVAANPMFIAQFITAGHNDSLMTALIVAGVYHATARRNWVGGVLGTVLVTVAVAVKPIALPILPFIGLLWAGKDASWVRRFMHWGYVGVLSLSLLALMGWMNGLGFGWIDALSTTGGQYIWYAPIGGVSWLASLGAAQLWGADAGHEVLELIGKVGKNFGMLCAVLVMFIGKDVNLVRRAGLSLAFVVGLAPMIQPWYLLWFIPLLAVSGIRNNWELDFYFLTTLFFMVYAICDQLDVSPYLENFDQNMARLIASVISLGYASYLVFVDPATRRVLRSKNRSVVYDVIV